MSDLELPPNDIEKYSNMETKTKEQAQVFVCEKMGIGRTLYYRHIYPKIKDEFRPLFIDEEKGKASNMRIPTKRLKTVIAYFNKLLDRHVQRRKKEKEY